MYDGFLFLSLSSFVSQTSGAITLQCQIPLKQCNITARMIMLMLLYCSNNRRNDLALEQVKNRFLTTEKPHLLCWLMADLADQLASTGPKWAFIR
jgi:hypothetical protein